MSSGQHHRTFGALGRAVVESRRRTRSVVGDDDRTFVDDATQFPWRVVCSLSIEWPGKRVSATGWLAGPRHVLTAGHCIHDPDAGWARRVEVTPGRHGDRAEYGSFVSDDLDALPEWVHGAARAHDVGLIRLEEAVGDEVGFFACAAVDPDALFDRVIECAGYPESVGGVRQATGIGAVERIEDGLLFHTVDTTPGQSGGPIWLPDEDDGRPLVVAIHTGGFDVGNWDSNESVRIEGALIERIVEWVGA